MALATLSIDLSLGLATLTSDSGKAISAAEQLGRKIGDGLLVASQAAISVSTALATSSLAVLAWADRSIKATAELHGLAEQTGISASAIASLTTAADTSGVSLETIAGIVAKLNVTLSKPIDEAKGAGAALKAIGLNADQLRALKPDEQLELIAQKLAGFAEGAGRGAVAVTLLGKSGAQALPFLNDLAESGRSQIKLTDEQIAAADGYAKAQARSRSELQQLAQAAALQMLPALNATMEAFRDTAAAVIGVDTAARTLGTSTAVADFAETSVKALGFVVDAGDGVVRTFGLVGKAVGGYGAVAAAMLRGDLDQARKIGQAFRDDAEELLQAPLFSDRLAARLAASKLPAAAAAPKPVLNFRIPDTAKATAAAKEATAAYDALIRSITAKVSATEAELAGTGKVAESQQFALDVVTKLAAAEGKFTTEQKRAATAALEAYLPAAQALELRKQQAIAAEALAKSLAESTAAIDKEAQARSAANLSMQDALAEYGLTWVEIERLRIARLADVIATEKQTLAIERAHDLSDAEAAGMERNIALLQRQLELRTGLAAKVSLDLTDPQTGATRALSAYLDLVKNAGVATRDAVAGGLATLEDDLTRSITSGRPSITAFVNFAIAAITQLAVVRPLLASIFGGGSSATLDSGLAGLIRRFFGGSNLTEVGGTTGFGGPAVPYAKGDVFHSPTLFKFASGAGFASGVMGEAGPEAVMPLRRGRNGSLGVVATGGGSRPVTLNVINNGTPVKAQSSQRETAQGTVIDLVLDAVVQDVQGGGRTHDAIQRRFGLNPGGSTPRY